MHLISDRRALHRIPELDDRLPRTMEYLRSALSQLRCKLFSPIAGSLCAFFDFGQDHAIAFRSDADALPIQETTGLPFASSLSGQMHACGHDAHMAMLLDLARRLDRKEHLSHNVLLVFQPSEETTGGARRICQSGIFAQYHVRAIFGMHLWPDLPKGVIASRRGAMMSRSCELTVELTGRACHIAKAEEGIDALQAGAEFLCRCRALEAQEQTQPVLRFGRMESGTVRNAVSDRTRLEGSLRAFDDETFFRLQRGVRTLAERLSDETGCKIDVRFTDGYPAVANPPALYERALKAVEFAPLEAPVRITEDFSWYQQTLPGLFFFLGTGGGALHTPDFNFDEEILSTGADFWEALADAYQEDTPCCQP